MIKRGIGRAALAFAMIVAAVGISSPAQAATSFYAEYFHSGGATLVVKITGDMGWYNRSVGLNDVRLWLRGGYCGGAEVSAYAGTNKLGQKTYANYCSESGQWRSLPNATLNADVPGGANVLRVRAFKDDSTGRHYGDTYYFDKCC
ncbi:hypothetical protein [Streptosporangium sandarakinum]